MNDRAVMPFSLQNQRWSFLFPPATRATPVVPKRSPSLVPCLEKRVASPFYRGVLCTGFGFSLSGMMDTVGS